MLISYCEHSLLYRDNGEQDASRLAADYGLPSRLELEDPGSSCSSQPQSPRSPGRQVRQHRLAIAAVLD